MPTVKYKSGNNWVNVTTSGSIATDSTYGYVKIATDEDVAAGTDNTAAITAKQLKEQLGGSGGLVHIEGDETITGTKSFESTLQLKNNLSFRSYGTNDSGRLQFRAQPSDNVIRGTVAITDGYSTSGSGYTGFIAQMVAREGSTTSEPFNTMRVSNKGIEYIKEANDGTITGQYILIGSDGIIPQARLASGGTNGQVLMTNGTNASWASFDDSNLVHRTGDETIGGNKNFTGTLTWNGKDVITENNKSTVVGWGMPDYSAGVGKSNGVNYTENVNGMLYVFGSGGNSSTSVSVSGKTVMSFNRGGEWWGNNSGIAFIPKGATYSISGASSIVFYPLIGG